MHARTHTTPHIYRNLHHKSTEIYLLSSAHARHQRAFPIPLLVSRAVWRRAPRTGTGVCSPRCVHSNTTNTAVRECVYERLKSPLSCPIHHIYGIKRRIRAMCARIMYALSWPSIVCAHTRHADTACGKRNYMSLCAGCLRCATQTQQYTIAHKRSVVRSKRNENNALTLGARVIAFAPHACALHAPTYLCMCAREGACHVW